MARARVNLALLMLTVLAGCRLGRPPAAGPFSVGRVHVAVPEPALGDALSAGPAAALSRHGALGSGPAISIRVLGAAEQIRAASGMARVHAVDLRLEVTVTGPRPRSLVWTGTREYGASGVDPLADTHARAEAWRRLSARAGDEIAAWILHAPPERS
ncbi:MAG: hypothetical protein VX265_17990 [Myxococcota bacterium]|nr:hypothetical protein [Myxococcota bacterium]